MSAEAMEWLWANHDKFKSGSEVAVMSYLCWKANPLQDHQVWHSQGSIARATSLSPNTVGRVLKALEERGIIERGDQDLAGLMPRFRRPVVWRIVLDTAQRIARKIRQTVLGCTADEPTTTTTTHPHHGGGTPPTVGDNKKLNKNSKKLQADPSKTPPRSRLAAIAAQLVREGVPPRVVNLAIARFHQRPDLYSPGALRFLAQDILDEEAARPAPFTGEFAPPPPPVTVDTVKGDANITYYEPPEPKVKTRPTYSPLARARAMVAMRAGVAA